MEAGFKSSSCRFGMRCEVTGIPTNMHNVVEKPWQAASGSLLLSRVVW